MQNVKLALENMLSKRNKTMYALAKETGVSYPTIHKLAKKEVQSIDLKILEKICINLHCTPNDLLPIKP